MTSTDPADIARALSEAQRRFVSKLTCEWKHWPNGLPPSELEGLRGFGKSGLVEGRYEHSGVYMRLTPLGKQVRNHLLHRPTSDASTDRTPATVGGCGRKVE